MPRRRHLNHCPSTHSHLMIPKLLLPILDMVVVTQLCAGAPHLICRPANWIDRQFHNQVGAMPMLPPEMLLRLPNAMTPAVDIWAFGCTESSCCFCFCPTSPSSPYRPQIFELLVGQWLFKRKEGESSAAERVHLFCMMQFTQQSLPCNMLERTTRRSELFDAQGQQLILCCTVLLLLTDAGNRPHSQYASGTDANTGKHFTQI